VGAAGVPAALIDGLINGWLFLMHRVIAENR
jgi:hypothetical protein